MRLQDDKVYFWKRGKKYYYKLEGESSFHSTGQTNITLARAYVNRILEEGIDSKETLNDYAKDFYLWDKCEWIKRQHSKGKSFNKPMARSRRSQLEKYILPKFGKKKIYDINPVDFENWLITLDLANGTKNSILYTLNIILKEAKREKLIKYNPLADVEPLANNYKRRDALSLEEVRKLFPDDKEELLKIWNDELYAVLYFVMVSTGMRSGEIRALQWKHFKEDQNGLLVVQAFKEDNTLGTTKSKEYRSVVLPDVTINLLKNWRENSLFPDDEHFIFYGSFGDKPLNKTTISKRFKIALERTGIASDDRNLVTHSLRHTYNTLMRNVLTENMLHYMIGHKSIAMTDRYDQGTPEQRLVELNNERDKINNIWN